MAKKLSIIEKADKVLAGRVSNQEAATAEKTHPTFPEIVLKSDTFRITVKDDDGKEVYKNDSEPFEFPEVPSLVSALRLNGANLTDDQITFINEALKGSEETGKAVATLLEDINSMLRDKAKSKAYAAKFNEHKPIGEEQIDNAYASMIRNAVKTSGVSPETALTTLQSIKLIPADYTLEMYNSNKGKR